MEKLEFKTQINASKEKVWDILWNDNTYPQWTEAFTKGSYAISDWQEGSTIQFFGPNNNGMYSVIDKKIPFTQISFKHLGEIVNGKQEEKPWAGATESYFLNEENGITELVAEVDATNEFKDFLINTFPKALALVKQLSEN